MRIIAGAWRGRRLVAPAGQATRPTAERLRQAVFDMLMHAPADFAPWGGVAGALVLDLFAGTGALGLEALSRGAAGAEFYETDRAALVALRANVAALGAVASVVPTDACRVRPGPVAGLVFLDPPYGHGLVQAALTGLAAAGRADAATLVVAELARDEPAPGLAKLLAERAHGAGRVVLGHVATTGQ